eukprot:6769879-Pyramimonas_sp.AAC.1
MASSPQSSIFWLQYDYAQLLCAQLSRAPRSQPRQISEIGGAPLVSPAPLDCRRGLQYDSSAAREVRHCQSVARCSVAGKRGCDM